MFLIDGGSIRLKYLFLTRFFHSTINRRACYQRGVLVKEPLQPFFPGATTNILLSRQVEQPNPIVYNPRRRFMPFTVDAVTRVKIGCHLVACVFGYAEQRNTMRRIRQSCFVSFLLVSTLSVQAADLQIAYFQADASP